MPLNLLKPIITIAREFEATIIHDIEASPIRFSIPVLGVVLNVTGSSSMQSTAPGAPAEQINTGSAWDFALALIHALEGVAFGVDGVATFFVPVATVNATATYYVLTLDISRA